MAAIWQNDGTRWALLAPVGFPDEAALHRLVEEAPQILPLAGSPALVVVGREVQLGNGYADLLAVEPSGRLAVIEVKLSRNAEARRAVVAQILAYAAYLHNVAPDVLERDILGRHLRSRGHETLLALAQAGDQQGALDPATFAAGLAESLGQGRFRLVLVLDEAPDELVRLVGYLQAISDKLVIDLIAVSSYRVADSEIIVPRRVEAERQSIEPTVPIPKPAPEGQKTEGAEAFIAAIETARPEHRDTLRRLAEWAQALAAEGLVNLSTFRGSTGMLTLLPRLKAEDVGLVTIWNDGGTAYLSLWRGVFERRAPRSLERVEALIGKPIGQGNTVKDITDELLVSLTNAYREANGRAEQAPEVAPSD